MLDPRSIEIDDVKRSIRPGGRVNRSKPRILGGQKFAFLFVWRTSGGERRTVLFQNISMHQIRKRLTRKGVATKIHWQSVAPVDGQSATGVKISRRFRIESLGRLTDRKDSRCGALDGQLGTGRGDRRLRIAA